MEQVRNRILTAAFWGIAATASAAAEPVPLELVLAMDVSTSVDAEEFALQQFGTAQAFRDPAVVQAIEATGGLAVSVVQWAGDGEVRVAVPWSRLETAEDAAVFADAIAIMPRMVRGFTFIDGAIRFAAGQIEQNDFSGARKVIDVSGDGTATNQSPAAARNAAVAQGITVNGLVILVGDMDLGILADQDTYTHYRDQVIGGPGAFLIKADGFADFARAMQEKLLREISGPMMSGLPRVYARQ